MITPTLYSVENCAFNFKCPMLLENLPQDPNNEKLHYCNKCEKNVYVVENVETLRQYVTLGRCVAMRIFVSLV